MPNDYYSSPYQSPLNPFPPQPPVTNVTVVAPPATPSNFSSPVASATVGGSSGAYSSPSSTTTPYASPASSYQPISSPARPNYASPSSASPQYAPASSGSGSLGIGGSIAAGAGLIGAGALAYGGLRYGGGVVGSAASGLNNLLSGQVSPDKFMGPLLSNNQAYTEPAKLGGRGTLLAARFAIGQIKDAGKEIETEQDESDASHNTDRDAVKSAQRYSKDLNKEYSGIEGGARYQFRKFESGNTMFGRIGKGFNYINPANLASGIGQAISGGSFTNAYKAADPDQEIADLQNAEEKARRDDEMAKRQAEGIKYSKAMRRDDAREQETAAEANAPDAAAKGQVRTDYEYQQRMQKADELAAKNPIEAGFKEGKEGQDAQSAKVAKHRTAAAAIRDGENARRAKEQSNHEAGLSSEAKEADLTTSGNLSGARREKNEAEIRRGSEEAHARSADEGKQYDATVAPAKRREFEKQESDRRVDDEEEATDKITKINAEANEAREKASGDSYAAERDAKFAAIDAQGDALQRAADREVDVNKKAAAQKVADAAKAAGAVEKQSFDAGHTREDREGAETIQHRTAASAERFAGNDVDADEYEAATKAADEIRKDRREGRPEVAAATQKEFAEKKQELDYRRDKEAHGRDTAERDSAFRAAGQGKLAEYNDFREEEAEKLRKAQMSGDPDRVSQARRTVSNDFKAYQKEHQEHAQIYGSIEDYASHLLTDAENDHGQGLALQAATRDAATVSSGGTLSTDATGQKLNDGVKAFADAAAEFKKMLADAEKLVVLR